jgi:hypothetical protein
MKKILIFVLTGFMGLLLVIASEPGPKLVNINNNHLELSVKPKDIQPGSGVKPDIDFGKIPLYFIFNKGQVNEKAKFYAKASCYTLWLTKEGLVFDSTKKVEDGKTHPAPPGHPSQGRHTPPFGHPSQEGNYENPHSPELERDVSRLIFLDANKNPDMVPIEETQLRVNYFIGNDKSKWHCDIPTSLAVLYKNLYKDIDLKVYGLEKQIEYDWIVKPGGDPGGIRFQYKNVKGTRIDEEGNLLIETDFGELMHKKPVSYQTRTAHRAWRRASGEGVGAGLRACPEERKAVNVTFKKIAENTYGFEVGTYDLSRELIIDPVVLAYSTYLGGGSGDYGRSIAVDGIGNAYVTGSTWSTNFPILDQYQGDQGSTDVFVAKLDPTQSGAASLLYSTYLGGGSDDQGIGIAVDGSGNAYVMGSTTSTDFPTLNPYQGDQGGRDVFVTRLDPTQSGASGLLYSTYLGGGSDDWGYGIAVDSIGNAYVTGDTSSTNFPILDQYQADQRSTDVFVTKLFFVAPPTVDTPTSAAVTYTTATLGGNVADTGGANVTERGVYWSTTDGFTPSGEGTKVSETGNWGTGTFTAAVSGLPPGSTIYFKAFATNSAGTGYSAQASFTTPAFTAPTVTTVAVSNITTTSADSGGNVTADGGSAVTARGVCWSTSANPTTADSITSDGTGTGTFTSSITGLNPGITYHVRAYATNSVGTSYGSDLTFTTAAVVPTVTTTAVSNITTTSADSGGNVTSDGGSAVTARGVCWSTSPNPRTTDNKTDDGNGIGPFTSNITGLMGNTTYYLRAYATNSAGTGYGKKMSFSTPAESITVTIIEPQDNARVSGTVTIKATAASNTAKASNASILAVQKVEFYVDDDKIAEDSGEPYETTWDSTLVADGDHTIKAVAYNAANQTSQDQITVHVGNIPPEIMLNRTHLNFGSVPRAGTTSFILNSTNLTTGSQTVLINNIGGGTLNWTVSKDADWLTCTPGAGTGPGAVAVSADTSALAVGTYNATITIQDPNASNSPQTVPVALKVYSSGTTTIPFGYFETPLDNSTVMSSIPVTGWALDDIDITGVKIYRAPIPGHETVSMVYIGDAVMVDGARPDVEQQFPDYPKDYQAGWGYMMLTNYLPFQGNGTFTIYAKATDKEGNEVTLGSKTITCDNANAVKPFGAIDTPGQGGIASGNSYVNFGWALTPQPNTIPTNGSTITVWVDGVPLGSPVYNRFRQDVAQLFPGCNNSKGAGGYFYLDTTNYLNGVHTIAWSARDNAGNRDGIGSRYFTVLNIGSGSIAAVNSSQYQPNRNPYFSVSFVQQAALSRGPVYVKKGYDRNAGAQLIYPGGEGIITIQSREDQRVEIYLGSSLFLEAGTVIFGYMIKGDRLQPLPIGSTMDIARGIFYWQPGAGFVGRYRFVFVEKAADDRMTKKYVKVVIHPRF